MNNTVSMSGSSYSNTKVSCITVGLLMSMSGTAKIETNVKTPVKIVVIVYDKFFPKLKDNEFVNEYNVCLNDIIQSRPPPKKSQLFPPIYPKIPLTIKMLYESSSLEGC